jgi:hypothetical protein
MGSVTRITSRITAQEYQLMPKDYNEDYNTTQSAHTKNPQQNSHEMAELYMCWVTWLHDYDAEFQAAL